MGHLWDKTNHFINKTIKQLAYLRKQSKNGLINSNFNWKAYSYGVGIFVLAFLVTFLAASLFTPTKDTNAEQNDSSSVSADGYTLTLSSTSAVNLGLAVTDTDTMTVGLGAVSVVTTSPGYRLYISMAGDTTSLSGIADGLSGSIAATSGTFAAPAALTRGTWGYAIPSSGVAHLAPGSGFSPSYLEKQSESPDDSKLFAIPPTSASNPQLIGSSTSSTAGDDFPIYYAVRANADTAPGDYTNKVLFTAVADAATSETMTLTPNTVATGSSSTIAVKTSLYGTAEYSNANIYLLTSTQYSSISGTNVEALGVSPLSCAKTSNTPVTYNCTLPAQSTTGTYYIYAKAPQYDKVYAAQLTVEDPIPTNFFDLETMQDMATYPSLCSTATTPVAGATALDTTGAYAGNTSYVPTIELRDTRDDNVYTVSKLADGNCWMTENLKLGKDTTMTLTSADSDVVNDFEIPAVQTSGSTSWGDASNSGNAKHVYATGDDTYGNYYNWYTATAGTGIGTMSSTSASSLTNATDSICPKGWRLPDGGTSATKSWYALDVALDGTGENRTDTTQKDKFISSPYNFPYSGYYSYGGGVTYRGSAGGWWSRSAFPWAGQAYNFYLEANGRVNPQHAHNVGYGFAVRCVAE